MSIRLLRPLVGVCLLSVTSLLSFAFAGEPDFLDADQAFNMHTEVVDGRAVALHFDVAPGYHLYKSKIQLGADNGAVLGTPDYPAPVREHDAQFGDTDVYRGRVDVTVPVQSAPKDFVLTVKAQGCADAGLCYPPFARTARVVLPEPVASGSVQTSVGSQADVIRDDTSRISNLLDTASLPWVLATFFGFGLLLALTPCVFPMIPILSGIIVGQWVTVDKRRGLALSVAYVLGMALTYTAAGIFAGLSGGLLSAALQNPLVLSTFSFIFVVLALSMFDVYQLQLPAAWQEKLNQVAGRQGGSLMGVGMMGALSALIVGPCVAAPLAGALLYIAQTHNAALGGATLFAMALGMGAPLIVVGVAAGHVLPRAGAWMTGVKPIFGVVMLAVALWLVQSVLPVTAAMIGWAVLLIATGVYARALDPLAVDAGGASRLCKAAGILSALTGICLFVGALSGSQNLLQPLAGLRGTAAVAQTQTDLHFDAIHTPDELDARLAQAQRPAALDFYADWCVACKEMERLTFADPEIRARFAGMDLLRVDVTHNTPADNALLRRYRLFGPPGIIFLAADGHETQRVVGFKNVESLAHVIDTMLSVPMASPRNLKTSSTQGS